MTGFESKELFPQNAAERVAQAEREQRIALVHILTPEFHGLNPGDFDDIPDEVAARASAVDLQPSLMWEYIKARDRDTADAQRAIAYRTPNQGFVSVALTPEEYNAMSTSIEQLANRAFYKVLVSRDRKLQEATNDPMARARSDEDIRVANRGSLRPILKSQADMQDLLDTKIVPKIQLIERFTEMTKGRNSNLSRGTRESVSQRFDSLRTTVFDDMLDVIGLQRNWSVDMTERAKRIIQKRLYINGTNAERVANFKDMLALANEYYGHKQALIRTRISEANAYVKKQPNVLADIEATDEERRHAREAKQLSLDEEKS